MRQVVSSTVIAAATGSQTIEGLATANPFDLSVLETVKNELNIADGNTTQDTWISRAIQRGSAAIATYCARVFPVQTYQDIIWLQSDSYPYQVPGTVAPLQLSQWPLVIVGTNPSPVLSCIVTEGVNVTQSLVDGTDFISDWQYGQLVRLNQYTNFPTNWDGAPTAVQFSAGFPTVPADLEQALLLWIAGAYQSRSRDPLLRAEEQPGLGRREYWIPNAPESHFPPNIAELLDKYRSPVVN